ncbi:Mef2 protein [Pichia kluyveri]|uniref:Ribosome-releasing factor 2, mitochondrial n=1 Tax=Pichia kluyveri TaxID=36015 RepID=A0AAV5R1R1_PICKL|nr:Mef2 protein [Pichia kluyveri]
MSRLSNISITKIGIIFKRQFHISNKCFNNSYETELILKTPIKSIRNIGIIAHIDAGKTTTTERLMYYSGLTKRIGNVDEGDTITDYMTQEKDRGITIQSAAVTLPWSNHKINVIDTPGHADFTFEVIRSLRVLDGAVTIFDSVAGVEAQTEKVWKQAKDLNIPIIAYINKMDREGAGYGRCVKEIVGRLKTKPILINIPYFIENNFDKSLKFNGIIDIIKMKIFIWDDENDINGKKIKIIDLSNGLDNCKNYEKEFNEMLKCRESMIESLGELDDKIIENFFETEDYCKVSNDLLNKSIRELTIKGKITPILCGSSFKNMGVQPLMDAIVDYLPSPLDISPPEVIGNSNINSNSNRKKKGVSNINNNNTPVISENIKIPSIIDPNLGCIINNNKTLTTGLAFKVINHPNRGLMTFVRIYSGKLQPNSTIINSRTGEQIKIGKLLIMNGENQLDAKYLSSGNIGVITGTDEISTGDSIIGNSIVKNIKNISQKESNLKLLPIKIPPPVFSVAIEPTTIADKRKLDNCLNMMIKEDPSLKLTFDEESGQSILSGMGELHLEITKDRLINDMKVNADIGDICVTYKETILKNIDKCILFEDGTGEETINEANGDEINQFGINLTIYSFEDGNIYDLLKDLKDNQGKNFKDESLNIIDLNTGIIFDKDSNPTNIENELKLESWTLNISYEKLINSMISGTVGSLQMGGRLARLPIQNVLIYVNKYYIPEIKDLTNNNLSKLIKITRESINFGLNSLNDNEFTILEPIMKVRTFVLESDVGNVSQDIMSVRNGKILSIENENESEVDNDKDDYDYKKLMEDIYVPFDPTMKYVQENDNSNIMIIKSEAPLREMIGYLTKLRSLTKGRGVYDMELKGMERANSDRVKMIIEG